MSETMGRRLADVIAREMALRRAGADAAVAVRLPGGHFLRGVVTRWVPRHGYFDLRSGEHEYRVHVSAPNEAALVVDTKAPGAIEDIAPKYPSEDIPDRATTVLDRAEMKRVFGSLAHILADDGERYSGVVRDCCRDSQMLLVGDVRLPARSVVAFA